MVEETRTKGKVKLKSRKGIVETMRSPGNERIFTIKFPAKCFGPKCTSILAETVF